MSAGEVLHTSSTGGTKAGNDDRYDLLPPRELRILAALHHTKYSRDWAGGSFNELNNQLWKFWEGDDVDPETGFLRPALVAYQALELLATEVQDEGVQLVQQEDSIYRFDNLPSEPLRLLAHHYGVGARKYADDNWQKGYDWRLTFAALNRHLWQHQAGQFIDEETGSPHLVAVAWHAITLLWFYENRPEFDTRTSTKQRIAEEEADWAWFEAQPRGTLSTDELADALSLNDPFVDPDWESKLRSRQPKGPVYYISGPMTGMPEHNFPAFNAKAAELRAQGYTVINPAELPGEGTDYPWEWFLRRDLIAMLEGGADRIWMLPGWQQSRGAMLEHHVARELGFAMVYPEGEDGWFRNSYAYRAEQLDTQREAWDPDWWLSAAEKFNDIAVDLDSEEKGAA